MKNPEIIGATGSIFTVLSSLTLADWAQIFGILFGLCTILLTWYYKERDMRLKEKALQYEIELKEHSHEKK